MTDRLKGAVVVFADDIREDDAKPILEAIRMIKGVASATGRVANMDDHMNRERVRHELEMKLVKVLRQGTER